MTPAPSLLTTAIHTHTHTQAVSIHVSEDRGSSRVQVVRAPQSVKANMHGSPWVHWVRLRSVGSLGFHIHSVHQQGNCPVRELCTFIVLKDSLFLHSNGENQERRDPRTKEMNFAFHSVYWERNAWFWNVPGQGPLHLYITFSKFNSTNPHFTSSCTGRLKSYLSYWAAAKYRRGSAVLSWLKQDY